MCRHAGKNMTSTFFTKQKTKKRINSTDYLVAKDKIKKETPMLSEVAQNFLSEIKGGEKKKKRQCIIHRTCHLLYCMFRQAMHLHKKDNYTFSRAGLLPPSSQTQTDEITERQTALAHSVCRVYMTMLK